MSPNLTKNNSLGELCLKFVSIMQASEGGIVSLKDASDLLDLKAKRRIYDITNVLEGIGLVYRKHKNFYQWRGDVELNKHETWDRLEFLKHIQDAHLSAEFELDNAIGTMKKCLAQTMEENKRYLYINRGDFLDTMGDSTILVVKNHEILHKAGTLEEGLVTVDRIVIGSGNKDVPIDCWLVQAEGEEKKGLKEPKDEE